MTKKRLYKPVTPAVLMRLHVQRMQVEKLCQKSPDPQIMWLMCTFTYKTDYTDMQNVIYLFPFFVNICETLFVILSFICYYKLHYKVHFYLQKSLCLFGKCVLYLYSTV